MPELNLVSRRCFRRIQPNYFEALSQPFIGWGTPISNVTNGLVKHKHDKQGWYAHEEHFGQCDFKSPIDDIIGDGKEETRKENPQHDERPE